SRGMCGERDRVPPATTDSSMGSPECWGPCCGRKKPRIDCPDRRVPAPLAGGYLHQVSGRRVGEAFWICPSSRATLDGPEATSVRTGPAASGAARLTIRTADHL